MNNVIINYKKALTIIISEEVNIVYLIERLKVEELNIVYLLDISAPVNHFLNCDAELHCQNLFLS